MTEHEYVAMMGRKPKPDCPYCYGQGDEIVDWDIGGGEVFGQIIDIPHYAPCRCMTRWYDAPIGRVKEWWKWHITYRRLDDDDIPF